MQLKTAIGSIALAAALALSVGCGKEPETTPQTPPDQGTASPASPSSTSTSETPEAGGGVMDTVKSVGEKVGEEAKALAADAQQAATGSTEAVQRLIEDAKTLIAEKNLPEAAGRLRELSGMALTPEQKQVVADLKTEVDQLTVQVDQDLEALKTGLADKDYAKASEIVSKLTTFKLSPEQQEVFNRFKQELEKALGNAAATNGVKAVKDLLQGNK